MHNFISIFNYTVILPLVSIGHHLSNQHYLKLVLCSAVNKSARHCPARWSAWGAALVGGDWRLKPSL